MYFEIIGEVEEVETIAIGGKIRDIMRIQKQYGPGYGENLKERQIFVWRVEGYAELSYTGMKPTASVERK